MWRKRRLELLRKVQPGSRLKQPQPLSPKVTGQKSVSCIQSDKGTLKNKAIVIEV